MTTRALFYVQHLKGIGHVVRAARIVSAMQLAGMQVTVAFGGMPVPGFFASGVTVRELPPLRVADGGFSILLDGAGREIDEAFKARRRAALLAVYDDCQPDLVVTEMYPFGRRAMRFELDPLIARVADDPRRPRLVASVRDILQTPRDPSKAAAQTALVARHYDLVLVHGDPTFIRLEESFPAATAIRDRLRYTGLVGPELAGAPVVEDARADVVVSVGGGAVGSEILMAALEAKRLTRLADARWLLLTGPNVAPAMATRLAAAAVRHGAVVETFRRDLPETMRTALASIQMAGYNTVADMLAADCRAVLVPYAEAGETEQSVRATRLVAMRRAVMLAIDDLSPAALARAVDEALELPEPRDRISFDGAHESARLLAALMTLPRA